MHTGPFFFEPDRAASLAFVEARGFGVVGAYDGEGLVMAVEEIEGGFRFNRHKSEVDHAATTQAHANEAATLERSV